MINKLVNISPNKTCNYTNYSGIVTMAIYEKDTLISTTTAHNTGMPKLFSFINSCLAGDFQAAKSTRPCKIVLLKDDDSSTQTESFTEDYAVSTPVLYDRAAEATSTTEGGTITYHFRIPSLALASGEEVKKLLLLPATYTSFEKDACARFVLDTAIKLPEKSNNTTVIIDWTLNFTNKNINKTEEEK